MLSSEGEKIDFIDKIDTNNKNGENMIENW